MVGAVTEARDNRREEIEALLILDQIPGVGLRTLRRVVDAAGSASAAVQNRDRTLARLAGRDAARTARDPAIVGRVREALALADRHGMQVVIWTDAEYPPELHNLSDPPPLLFLRGRAELLGAGAVTVVGARRATARARETSRRLGRALAHAGRTVASGLALGVDGAAHQGALDVDGNTLAVLGRSAETPYPPSHRRLFGEIGSRGLLVSEFMPGTDALPYHFPRRNRILAALADAVVVVEAGRKSGSLITVEHALDLGVDVYAVPGPIDEKACAGSNALLRDGAKPLISIEDFVREITGADPAPRRAPSRLDGDEAELLASLEEGCPDVGELAARTGLPVPKALALLARLEVRGWIEQLPGRRFRRA